ncbi:MAG: DUF4388 domain-containing protein [Polyangiaceae bacterium]|nr:DUF4388 domain-containing protein [Polyangiaceae bacterium]
MRSIVLLEPDLDSLAALASELRQRGLTVVLADDAEGAVERVRRSAPDAVVVSEALLGPLLDADLDGALAELPRFVLADRPRPDAPSEQLPRADADAIARRLLSIPPRTAPAAIARGDFRGDVSQIALPDLLQLLSMNRRTGTLALTLGSGAGEIRLVEGELTDAVYRRLEGEKALFRLLGENEGAFSFVSTAPAPLRRIVTPASHLLMEGMRQLDELRRLRGHLGDASDALLAIGGPRDGDTEVVRRVLELTAAPRTLDELLDELPEPDLAIVEAMLALLERGELRSVPRGAVAVELAEPDRLNVLAAVVRRRTRAGFGGAPRLVLAATPRRLTTVGHALRRIADAVGPSEPAPAAPIPHALATLRLAEGVALEVLGLPALDAYAPLWPMTLAGAVAVVRIDAPSGALDAACAVTDVLVLDAASLVGAVDDADPAHVALLVRSALEATA